MTTLGRGISFLPVPTYSKINGRPYVTVSAKGLANGLSSIPNDGADFGPDTMLGATSPTQYGPPYTATSGIQEAYNSLIDYMGTIYLKEGIYYISETLSFLIPTSFTGISTITFTGSGIFSTRIYTTDNSIDGLIVNANSKSVIFSLKHFELYNANSSGTGLTIQNTSKTRIDSVEIRGNWELAYHEVNSDTVYATRLMCIANGVTAGSGIRAALMHAEQSIYENCAFLQDIGVETDGSMATFYNCDFEGCGTVGIRTYVPGVGGANNTLIDNCFFANQGGTADYFIDDYAGNYTIITRNTFSKAYPANIAPIKKFGSNHEGGLYYKNFDYSYPPTISANPPVSGTVYQNTNPCNIRIYLPAYATTSGTSGTVDVALGSSSTPSTITTVFVSGDTSSSATKLIELVVPAGWYYSFTASGVTFTTATVVEA